MVDLIDADNNLKRLKKNCECLESYNHLYSSFPFKQSCEAELKALKKQIHNLELNIRKHQLRQEEDYGM